MGNAALKLALLSALVLWAGCASTQSFTQVDGNLRISAQVQRSLLQTRKPTLSLYLTDASTAYPLDAKKIEIRTASGERVKAKRTQLGSYVASLPDAHRVDVLVSANDETAVLTLMH